MRTNLIIVLSVLLAASACSPNISIENNNPPGNVNDVNSSPAQKNAEEAKTPDQPPMPVMDLLTEFQKDQDAATKKYKRTWVVVKGPVEWAEKDSKGRPAITFQRPGTNPNKYIEWVVCTFGREQENAVLALKKGDNVTLRGQVGYYSLGTVWIYKCTLQ